MSNPRRIVLPKLVIPTVGAVDNSATLRFPNSISRSRLGDAT
ncbi:MAG TPA: hypothetical protein VK821_11715 [Dehalococcoidia bacterium]|nr:hypothetical protein [Dehalococcoidia bacterium]